MSRLEPSIFVLGTERSEGETDTFRHSTIGVCRLRHSGFPPSNASRVISNRLLLASSTVTIFGDERDFPARLTSMSCGMSDCSFSRDSTTGIE